MHLPRTTTPGPSRTPTQGSLPLSDRILFVVSRQSATVRGLSQLLCTDIETVRKTLWGLEEKGLVERADEGPPIVFCTAPHVAVEYRPSRIVVTTSGGARRASVLRLATNGRCSAVTTRGTPCKLRAVAGGYCSYHAEVPEP